MRVEQLKYAIEELERAKQCHPDSGYFNLRIRELKRQIKELENE